MTFFLTLVSPVFRREGINEVVIFFLTEAFFDRICRISDSFASAMRNYRIESFLPQPAYASTFAKATADR
jgi:hypothetical protein